MTKPLSHQYQLHVLNRWYDLIASSTKVYEGRLCEPGVKAIQFADVIVFSSEDRVPLFTRVISVTRYDNFDDMLDGDGLGKLLPGVRA